MFVLSLEQSADIVSHQVARTAMRRHSDEGAMPEEHTQWLCEQSRLLADAHEISVAVFIRRDLDLALKMVDIKTQMRSAEQNYVNTRPADHFRSSGWDALYGEWPAPEGSEVTAGTVHAAAG